MAGRSVVGVGTDVVEVSRIARALQRPGFVTRMYSAAEIEYCSAHNSEGSHTELSVQRFAVRFAAKEAVLKAMGVGLGAVKFADISVTSTSTGAPQITLTDTALNLASSSGINGWLVSLSHSDLVAQAFVAAVAD